MNEFQRVVRQMNLTDDENLINDAFAFCDKDNSGKLCMQDFEKAYDVLYRSVLNAHEKDDTDKADEVHYMFKCLRYGVDKDGEPVFEITILFTIKELNALMRDKVAPDDGNKKIKWWIDVAIIRMNFAEKELVAKLLGISKNDIVLTGVLPENRQSRMHLGQDAVSFFMQTMWIKNIPLIHSHPELKTFMGETLTYLLR